MGHLRSLDIQSTNFCNICPRHCKVDRLNNEFGFCGKSLIPEIAHYQLHEWEEPCISCGAGSGTVFFSGCNLGCVYCQNYLISGALESEGANEPRQARCPSEPRQSRKVIRPSEPRHADERLSQIMLELQNLGAANINLVTPTHFAPYIRAEIAEAKKSGLALPVIWNTSSYECPEQISMNKGLVDIYLADMKYASPEIARLYSAASDYFDVAVSAIEEMVETVGSLRFDDFDGFERMISGVIVRHMVLPGRVEDSCEVIARIHSRFGDAVRLSIMNQYTPVLNTRANDGDAKAKCALSKYPELGRSVTSEEYERVLDFADSIGVENYYWQEGETCKESFIPAFESSLDFK